MKITKYAFIMILASTLNGCGNTLHMTYKSDPLGATVYSGGKNLGRTPVTLEYEISEEADQNKSMIIGPVSVRWLSGAKIELPARKIDLSLGKEQECTLLRPTNAAGNEIDAEFATEMIKAQMKLKAEQRQIDLLKQQNKRQEELLQSIKDDMRTMKLNTNIPPISTYSSIHKN